MAKLSEEKLQAKVDQLLQEIRIVLPGTQALLGFQFIAFFNQGFLALPDYLKNLHMLSLLMTTICTVLLITPVAYQRIGESGRNTPRFVTFTSRILTTAMVFLVGSLTGAVFVAGKVLEPDGYIIALSLAVAVMLFAVSVWFILPGYLRKSE